MASYKVLIVDDDVSIRKLIRRSLEIENILSEEVDNGFNAIDSLSKQNFDLIILDINMHGMDGFEVIQEIRKKNSITPIFLVSARTEDHDKILGFGIGANAYITKPFSPAVLVAMVKSELRKNKFIDSTKKESIEIHPFLFDKKTYTLFKNKVEIPLSSKEAKIMRFFMENSDKVFTKNQLFEHIWNEVAITDNNIMVFIRKLRQKIEDDPQNPVYLKTVWGIGYKFNGINKKSRLY